MSIHLIPILKTHKFHSLVQLITILHRFNSSRCFIALCPPTSSSPCSWWRWRVSFLHLSFLSQFRQQSSIIAPFNYSKLHFTLDPTDTGSTVGVEELISTKWKSYLVQTILWKVPKKNFGEVAKLACVYLAFKKRKFDTC